MIFLFSASNLEWIEKDSVQLIIYTVKKGDTLWDISERFLEDPALWPELLKYNNIENPDLIFPGQKLYIPSSRVLTLIKEASPDEVKKIRNAVETHAEVIEVKEPISAVPSFRISERMQGEFHIKGRKFFSLSKSFDEAQPTQLTHSLYLTGAGKLRNVPGVGNMKVRLEFKDNDSERKIFKLWLEGSNWASYYGDYNLSGEGFRLLADSYNVVGVTGNLKFRNNWVGGFVARVRGAKKIFNFNGNGTQGPYDLGCRVVYNSDKVFIRKEGEIFWRKLKRGEDYIIDYEFGTLRFLKYLPSQNDEIEVRCQIIEGMYENFYGFKFGRNINKFEISGLTLFKDEQPTFVLKASFLHPVQFVSEFGYSFPGWATYQRLFASYSLFSLELENSYFRGLRCFHSSINQFKGALSFRPYFGNFSIDGGYKGEEKFFGTRLQVRPLKFLSFESSFEGFMNTGGDRFTALTGVKELLNFVQLSQAFSCSSDSLERLWHGMRTYSLGLLTRKFLNISVNYEYDDKSEQKKHRIVFYSGIRTRNLELNSNMFSEFEQVENNKWLPKLIGRAQFCSSFRKLSLRGDFSQSFSSIYVENKFYKIYEGDFLFAFTFNHRSFLANYRLLHNFTHSQDYPECNKWNWGHLLNCNVKIKRISLLSSVRLQYFKSMDSVRSDRNFEIGVKRLWLSIFVKRNYQTELLNDSNRVLVDEISFGTRARAYPFNFFKLFVEFEAVKNTEKYFLRGKLSSFKGWRILLFSFHSLYDGDTGAVTFSPEVRVTYRGFSSAAKYSVTFRKGTVNRTIYVNFIWNIDSSTKF